MEKTDLAANLLFGSRDRSFCDSCMVEAVELTDRHQAKQIRTALAESGSFSQGFGCCALCGRETVVIRIERS
jgi:hypothetical protein